MSIGILAIIVASVYALTILTFISIELTDIRYSLRYGIDIYLRDRLERIRMENMRNNIGLWTVEQNQAREDMERWRAAIRKEQDHD